MGRVGGGSLTLRGQGSLANLFELSLVGRRWQAFDFNAETKVTFEPSNYMQMAGLTNFYNHLCWSWVFVTWDEKRNKRVIEVAQNDFDTYTSFLKDTAIAIPDDIESVWLRTKVRTRTYTYEYSFDGKTWHEIPVTLDAAVLSDDHVPNVMADSLPARSSGWWPWTFPDTAKKPFSAISITWKYDDARRLS